MWAIETFRNGIILKNYNGLLKFKIQIGKNALKKFKTQKRKKVRNYLKLHKSADQTAKKCAKTIPNHYYRKKRNLQFF